MPDLKDSPRHSLNAITALGGTEPRIDVIGDVTCTEMPNIALASVAAKLGSQTHAQKALSKALGTAAPPIGGVSSKILTAFWIGPDQWMLEAPLDQLEDLAAYLSPLLQGCGYVTEQTDAWARFDLEGSSILDVLELLCNLDTRRMQNDTVSRSNIHHLGCFVRCITADHFAIYGPRASAQSLHHAITTAMRSAI